MSVGAVVVGIGQQLAGDDGVGPKVVRELGRREGVEIIENAEPLDLVELLQGTRPVVVVDAIVGEGTPGEVFAILPERLSRGLGFHGTTHGLGVAEAIELARTLSRDGCLAPVFVVGVRIPRPGSRREKLSPSVAAAVPRAAAFIIDLLGFHEIVPHRERSRRFEEQAAEEGEGRSARGTPAGDAR